MKDDDKGDALLWGMLLGWLIGFAILAANAIDISVKRGEPWYYAFKASDDDSGR